MTARFWFVFFRTAWIGVTATRGITLLGGGFNFFKFWPLVGEDFHFD